MTVSATSITRLLELAADYRRRVDQATAERRRNREASERQEAANSASNFVITRFRNILGEVLPAEAWQGYPSGTRDAHPLAVAHLGGDLFLMHRAKANCSEAGCDCGDTVTLLRPCPCGDYIEDVVDTEYDLALVIGDINSAACQGLCAPSGWRDPWE
ncbi:hypothetical protein [Streptomyces sp. NPDC001404]|uniref:hypothetical protein n=1 Tax=Streptomyces sp. NPDC001404 TaxID=3364571 RepID=UPI00368EAFE6